MVLLGRLNLYVQEWNTTSFKWLLRLASQYFIQSTQVVSTFSIVWASIPWMAHFRRRMVQWCHRTKIRTYCVLIVDASASHWWSLDFLSPKCNNFAHRHSLWCGNGLHLKRWFLVKNAYLRPSDLQPIKWTKNESGGHDALVLGLFELLTPSYWDLYAKLSSEKCEECLVLGNDDELNSFEPFELRITGSSNSKY